MAYIEAVASASPRPLAAEIARHVIDAFVAGDYRRAAQIQLQFALFPSKWMHLGLTATMKAAMRPIGLPVIVDGEIVGVTGVSSGTTA